MPTSRPPVGMDEDERLRGYWQGILAAVPAKLRAAVEAKMKFDISEAQPFIDRIETMLVEHGRAKGRLEAARTMFRHLANERGYALSAVHEARLEGCNDPERIAAWAVRLLKAASLDEALD